MCASEVLIVERACFQAGIISVDGKYSVSVIIKLSSLTRSYVQEDISGNSRALLAAPSAGCKTGVSQKVLWFFNCPESKLQILNSCPSRWNSWLRNLLERWAWKQLRPMWARPERGFAVPGGKSHIGGQRWQHGLGPQGCLRGRKDGARASGAQSDSEGLPAARNKAVFLILLKAHLLGV